MEWLFRRILGERANLSPARTREEIAEDVAIVAAIEHITAFLGDWVINAPALDRAGAHPVMLDLLRWHGAEEVEHRHVAFDLLVHLDPGYARRVRGTAMAWSLLVYLWARGARFLVRTDPDLDRTVRASWRGCLDAARRGLLPSPGDTIRSASLYLRRGYHPSQQFSTRQAVAYLGASPAAREASFANRPAAGAQRASRPGDVHGEDRSGGWGVRGACPPENTARAAEQ
jgi:predicted metal-dependent hydrolase